MSLNYFLNDLSSYYATSPGSFFPSGGSYVPVMFNNGGTQHHVVATGTINDLAQHEEKTERKSRESSAALIGGIGAIAFSAVSAFTLKSYLNNRKALQAAKEFQSNELPKLTPAVRDELAPIVKKHIEIVETNVSKTRNYSILAGVALGCAAAGFIGGMASIPWLITAAIVAGVATACVFAFLVVWNCLDTNTLPQSMQDKIKAMINQKV